jgi:hypothetical protein
MPRRPDLEAILATGGRQRDRIDFFVGSLTRGKGYCYIHSTHTLSACGKCLHNWQGLHFLAQQILRVCRAKTSALPLHIIEHTRSFLPFFLKLPYPQYSFAPVHCSCSQATDRKYTILSIPILSFLTKLNWEIES